MRGPGSGAAIGRALPREFAEVESQVAESENLDGWPLGTDRLGKPAEHVVLGHVDGCQARGRVVGQDDRNVECTRPDDHGASSARSPCDGDAHQPGRPQPAHPHGAGPRHPVRRPGLRIPRSAVKGRLPLLRRRPAAFVERQVAGDIGQGQVEVSASRRQIQVRGTQTPRPPALGWPGSERSCSAQLRSRTPRVGSEAVFFDSEDVVALGAALAHRAVRRLGFGLGGLGVAHLGAELLEFLGERVAELSAHCFSASLTFLAFLAASFARSLVSLESLTSSSTRAGSSFEAFLARGGPVGLLDRVALGVHAFHQLVERSPSSATERPATRAAEREHCRKRNDPLRFDDCWLLVSSSGKEFKVGGRAVRSTAHWVRKVQRYPSPSPRSSRVQWYCPGSPMPKADPNSASWWYNWHRLPCKGRPGSRARSQRTNIRQDVPE